MTAGYSGTPLIKKLGIKPQMQMMLINAPENYSETLGELPPDVTLREALPPQPELDFIQFFTLHRAELEARLPELMTAMLPNAMLWVSWVKKSAKIPTDITEDVIREVALPQGLVDVKVCAVDIIWSGLKLVYRLEKR